MVKLHCLVWWSWAVTSLMCLMANAATNEWYPGSSGFSGWPTNWVSISSLNDPKELSAAYARLDFVGDDFNPGAFWSADTNYFFIRMRVAVSNVISSTFRDSLFVYIDRVGYTNGNSAAGAPDYALAWDSKSNDATEHGLELMTGTNLTTTTYWSKMTLNDIDGVNNDKTAPPDFNLTGDGYLRTIDMCPTTNFGYTTFIDFGVKWSFLSANTALGTNQDWRIQFGSRNNATDHNFPQDDIAGGFYPASLVSNSYSSVISSAVLSAALDFSVYATAQGVTAEIWTVSENGHDDIVIYAWLDGGWCEVGRVPASKVWGDGSHCYTVRLSGLDVGGLYQFKVLDESGVEHFMPMLMPVQTIKMSAVRMERSEITMSFNTEEGRKYQVLASTDLISWAASQVCYPIAEGWSLPDSSPFTAGPGTQTNVRVPVSGRQHAYFKIIQARE